MRFFECWWFFNFLYSFSFGGEERCHLSASLSSLNVAYRMGIPFFELYCVCVEEYLFCITAGRWLIFWVYITLRLLVVVQWCRRWLPSHSHTPVDWLLSSSELLLLNSLLSRSSTVLTCSIFISYYTISNFGLLPLPFFVALS